MKRFKTAYFLAFAALLAALLVTVAPRRALAQADAATESARAEFSKGVARYDQSPPDYEGALTHFRAAYREKPVPAIKRNIALCLRGLGRHAEAMTALEEMLAEGGDTLKPDVRGAAQKAIAELAPKVAHVRVSVGFPGKAPGTEPQAEVTIDNVVITPKRLASPVRVDAGEHVFRARAAGHADAEVKVPLLAGQSDAIVSLELVSMRQMARGKLRIRANLPSAEIAIDGAVVGKGDWSGPLFAGRHGIEVSSPVGRYTGEITIGANEEREVKVVVARSGSYAIGAGEEPANPVRPGPAPAAPAKHVDVPPMYVPAGSTPRAEEKPAPPPEDKPPVAALPQKIYLAGGVAAHWMDLKLSLLFNDPDNAPRTFLGASIAARAGLHARSWFEIGVVGEIGGMTTEAYQVAGGGTVKLSTVLGVFAPEIRVHTRGPLRLFVGAGLGLTGLSVTASGGGVQRHAARGGFGLVGLADVGIQADIQKIFGELSLFGDLRDISAVGTSDEGLAKKTFPTGDVAARLGVRLMFGRDF